MPSLNRRRVLQLSAGLSLGSACPSWAQSQLADWSGDVPILREVWETMHPGLYRYSTSAEITTRLDALAETWRGPGSFRERFLALTRVTASIRCGHTYPSPYNGDDAMVAGMYPDRSLVPFRFHWIDGRMVVTEDYTPASDLPQGTVVTAIDGVATEMLLARLVPLARADGGNDAKRINLMEVRGEDRFETFDIHLPLILSLKDAAAFTLSDGRTDRARAAADPSGTPVPSSAVYQPDRRRQSLDARNFARRRPPPDDAQLGPVQFDLCLGSLARRNHGRLELRTGAGPDHRSARQ